MIDFHTHILPQIDDGSSCVEESTALLESLEEQGVTDVLLTPHYYGRWKGVEDFLRSREDSFSLLSAAYKGRIALRRACECNIATCANTRLSDLKPLAVEGTDYILIEMSFTPAWEDKLLFRVEELMAETGLTPVIAHVELYPAVQRPPALASELVRMGCLLQINCDSVAKGRKNDLVFALLRHSMAHCLGSDTHNTVVRPPLYRQAIRRIEETFGEGYVGAMQANMRRILKGEKVVPVFGAPVKKGLFGNYR